LFETIAWISIILGFLLVTVFSLAGMLITRRREQKNNNDRDTADQLRKIDEAADAALNELNKTAGLVLEEINEKYQSMLFLHTLLEEKKKEILLISETIKAPPKPRRKSGQSNAEPSENVALNDLKKNTTVKPKTITSLNPKHDEIIQLAGVGFSTAEIAKELNMGKGEVRLILDLARLT
jgi:DNA-directed RNA polymerase specialized sigma24 family protein